MKRSSYWSLGRITRESHETHQITEDDKNKTALLQLLQHITDRIGMLSPQRLDEKTMCVEDMFEDAKRPATEALVMFDNLKVSFANPNFDPSGSYQSKSARKKVTGDDNSSVLSKERISTADALTSHRVIMLLNSALQRLDKLARVFADCEKIAQLSGLREKRSIFEKKLEKLQLCSACMNHALGKTRRRGFRYESITRY